MDFILKKIVSMFIMPFPMGMFLIIVGLILLYKNRVAKAKFILLLSVVWMFFISYAPLVNSALNHFEESYPTLKQAPNNVKYIFVLGGGHNTNDNHPITSQVCGASLVRLSEGIRLYRQLKGKAVIVVSGYSGMYDPTPHAKMQEKLAIALGIEKKHIIVRPKPRDTHEEALAAKELIGDEPFILVTSASHMKRAMNFFKNENLNPIPAPTQHLAELGRPFYAGFFSASAIVKSHIVFHEMLGLIWQKIKG